MADSAPKISFGFSKLSKKPNLPAQKPETVKRVDRIQYIDSLENNSFNIINEDVSDKKELLVIPLLNPNSLLDSVKQAVNSRQLTKDKLSNGIDPEVSENESALAQKLASSDPPKMESLDDMAARELMEDSKKQPKEVENTTVIPISSDSVKNVESTLEDYENVPVSDFGLAMLRGMGWEPTKGVGKTEKVVKVTQPNLRPKGMGLGADKVINRQKPVAVNVPADNVLKKGSKVRITVGEYKNTYGTVEAFDDDLGRVSVRMSLLNETISINECYTQLVTSEEFNKYSKLININTYSKYVENENKSSKEDNMVEGKNISKKGDLDTVEIKTKSSSHYDSKELDHKRNEKKHRESSGSDDSDFSSNFKNDTSSRHKGRSSESKKSHSHRRRSSSASSSDMDRRKKDKYRNKKSQSKYDDSSSDDGRRSQSNRVKQKYDENRSHRREKYMKNDSDSSCGHEKKKKHKKGKRKNRSRSRSVDRRRR